MLKDLFTEQEKTSETINKQNIRMGRFAKAAGFAGIVIGFMVKP